jgi:exosortase E/protease (VPEID-CTERM system)
VSQVSSTATRIPKLRLGLPARVAILGTVFFAEKVFLNGFVDFDRAQAAQGLGAVVRNAQHWGFRFLVAVAAAVALFAYVRGGEQLKLAEAAIRSTTMRVGWMLAHLLLVACLMTLSYLLYRDGAAPLPFAAVVMLWITIGASAALSAILAMAPWRLWLQTAAALGNLWWYAAVTALLGASAMQLSQRLWGPTATLTFNLVRRVLLPFIPTLSADAATRVLSTDRFAVEVSEICSGLEGMGLMLAFTAAWLVYFRREYIFPRALVLIPIGLVTIFVLNILRIAALMLIGHAGYPGVAQYGFHSQAGWIAFNTVTCVLVFFSRRNTWLNRAAATPAEAAATENPTAAYVMPLLAILAAGVLSKAMSDGFETFYSLRLAAGVGVLALYRKKLLSLDWRWTWRGPATGLLVFLLWIVAAHFLVPEAAMPEPLAALSPTLRGAWIASRVAASVLTVPIAEELAYRGYLMRRLGNADFETVPFQRVRWPALLTTAILFGVAHGVLWLPGIAAGLAFGVVLVRSGRIGEAVAAHVTANALIAASVLGGKQWQLW